MTARRVAVTVTLADGLCLGTVRHTPDGADRMLRAWSRHAIARGGFVRRLPGVIVSGATASRTYVYRLADGTIYARLIVTG